MTFKAWKIWTLAALLAAFWGCAGMPAIGGGQAQKPAQAQMTQAPAAAQPSVQTTARARQVTHKGPKLRVGVVDFVNKSSYGAGRLGTSASDILTTELFKTGAFIVVERAQLRRVLGEQSLGQTGV